jgi:uncharacterized LabA/DUF88 family protein
MPKIRVACYIDGFNVYHAIDDMSRVQRGKLNYLKWVDLWSLMERFIDPNVHEIRAINYFSAYMTWHPDREARHRQYVKALEARGVKTVMGRFKEKDAYCKNCKTTYMAREEKESDVNIATHLISDAYEDEFDQAFLVSNDSDLLGPLRLLRSRFPKKRLKIIAPPLRRHSKELWALGTHRAAIKPEHLERCLFPAEVRDAGSNVIAQRPPEYDPPQ